MSSGNKKSCWKSIVVYNQHENTNICYNLDEQQRITPKLKHQKKRSIQLAKIGYYDNAEIKKFLNHALLKPLKIQYPQSQKLNQNHEKDESKTVSNEICLDDFEKYLTDFSMLKDEETDIFENDIFEFEARNYFLDQI